MSTKTLGIYFTHVPEGQRWRLAGVRVKINGRLAMAFVKDDKVLCYEFFEDLNRQMLSGPSEELSLPVS